jgi:hypothetical protein
MNKWDVDAARVGSSHQGPRTAEHVCGRLIRNFPNRPWSEWERRIGIAWCARRRKYWPFAVRSWRETVETDPVLLRYARCVAIPTTGGQDVNHRLCIKERDRECRRLKRFRKTAIIAPMKNRAH